MFSEEDLNKVREAVRAAERRTRGEIVPMIVPASARYREASHAAGLVAALFVLTGLLTLHGRGDWLAVHHGWILLAVVLGYAVGAAAGRFPAVIRRLVPNARLAFKVRRRAEAAFYEHGLHRTREGTGVLIVLSLLERHVQILADDAINARVPPGTWDGIVAGIVRGIRDGRPAEALCDAIAACGDLLAEHFPARRGDNPNELPDDVVRER